MFASLRNDVLEPSAEQDVEVKRSEMATHECSCAPLSKRGGNTPFGSEQTSTAESEPNSVELPGRHGRDINVPGARSDVSVHGSRTVSRP